MSSAESEIKIRTLLLRDLDAVFSIDKELRAAGKTITYANLTTEQIFHKDRRPADVARLFELGFVAEVSGRVCGFIIGETAHLQEAAKLGIILIIGVHPDYQRKGIAAKLVSALVERFRSEGIRTVRVGIDERDKTLISFVEQMGFQIGHLLIYSKTL